jgi:outer membrane receptor protein involved in Fe transport
MYRDAQERVATATNDVQSSDVVDRSESVAVLGEATRTFLDGRWEATQGLRHFRDDFTTEEKFSPSGPLRWAEGSSDALTPRAVVAWHPDERSTVYASYAQGFRSGLTQPPATLRNPLFENSGIGQAQPDTLHNYEIGFKDNYVDGQISVEAALYYMDWKNVKTTLQVPVTGPQLFISALVNGPGASGPGIDVMLVLRPIDGFEIGANASWNDLTLDERIETGGRTLYNKGDRLGSSPELTAQAFLEYSVPLGDLAGRFSLNASFISSQNSVAAGPIVWESDDITTVSSRFALESPSGWTTSLFVDNLFDGNGIPYNNAGVALWQPRLAPRTFGLQIEYGF